MLVFLRDSLVFCMLTFAMFIRSYSSVRYDFVIRSLSVWSL